MSDGVHAELQAGAELEVLTRGELRDELERFDLAKQNAIPAYKRAGGAGVMPSSGTLIIPIGGPPAGKWWDIRRVVITPADVTTTGLSTAIGIVFVGTPPQNATNLNPFEAVEAITGLPATFYVSAQQAPVVGTERIWVAIPAGPSAGTAFAATALVVELESDQPARQVARTA